MASEDEGGMKGRELLRKKKIPQPSLLREDRMARTLAAEVSRQLGGNFEVDNRDGANGIVGTQIGVNAPPDGYTMLGGTIATHAISSSLNSILISS